MLQKHLFIFIFISCLFQQVYGAHHASTKNITTEPAFKHSVGLVMMSQPRYKGSDSFLFQAFPFYSFSFTKSFYFSPYQGIGKTLLNRPELTLNSGLGFHFGRKESRDSNLNGLGSISPSPIIKLSSHSKLYYAFFKTDTSFGLGQLSNTIYSDISIGHQLVIPYIWIFGSLSYSLRVSNTHYHQLFYGITSSQEQQTNYPKYKPTGGLESTSLTLSLFKPVTKKTKLLLTLSQTTIENNAKKSPLVFNDTYSSLMGFVMYSL